ncbi:hypothetical protein [Nonomuraea typhae]|uniref:Uncharacterized protein n=1 Tax=Nonomuraea typhae TaxID=2603600 RepID=A0ABW7YQD8_9ACTN
MAAVSPLEVRFEVTHRFRPFDLIAPGFVGYDIVRPGAGPIDTGQSLAAPFGAVVLDVAALEKGGSVSAGLVSGGSRVIGRYAAGTVEIDVDGHVVADAPAELQAPYGFAVTVNGNMITVLAGAGETWRPLLTREQDRSDLRRPEVLAAYTLGFHSERASLARARAGYFGQVGVRDLHLVEHADGRPYLRDGKLFLTAGCAGMGFAQQAHWAVWALDPAAPERMEQVAKLFFAHDGIVTGDNAGQIVYDEERGRFVIVVCGGDLPEPGVYVRHAETTDDILSGVHVIPNRVLPAPMSLSAWEPSIAKIGERWHIAFADVVQLEPRLEFHPVLVASPQGGDYADDLAVVAADPSVRRTEGCVLHRFGGDWHLLATDDDDKCYRVYDLGLRQLATLDAPYVEGGPHPQIVRVSRDEWMMITFANVQYAEEVLGYGTEGDVVIMSASPPTRKGTPDV